MPLAGLPSASRTTAFSSARNTFVRSPMCERRIGTSARPIARRGFAHTGQPGQGAQHVEPG